VWESKEAFWACPAFLDNKENNETFMETLITSLGISGLVSVCAGAITIITTIVLFRVRYKAANKTVETANDTQEIKEIVQAMQEAKHNIDTSVSAVQRLSVASLEKQATAIREELQIKTTRMKKGTTLGLGGNGTKGLSKGMKHEQAAHGSIKDRLERKKTADNKEETEA
jgi:hypothetical protein